MQSIQSLRKIQAISIIANTATGKPRHAITNRHRVCQRKELEHKGGQRQVYDACVVMYCSWRKRTSQNKATLNSEEIIKLVTLFIVELCLAGASVN